VLLTPGKLYERSHFSNEIGAAINIGPNAAPVLQALGFDVTGARLMEVDEVCQVISGFVRMPRRY
jgi:salicylate hydroxylase